MKIRTYRQLWENGRGSQPVCDRSVACVPGDHFRVADANHAEFVDSDGRAASISGTVFVPIRIHARRARGSRSCSISAMPGRDRRGLYVRQTLEAVRVPLAGVWSWIIALEKKTARCVQAAVGFSRRRVLARFCCRSTFLICPSWLATRRRKH